MGVIYTDTSRTFIHPTEDIERYYTLPLSNQRIENDDTYNRPNMTKRNLTIQYMEKSLYNQINGKW